MKLLAGFAFFIFILHINDVESRMTLPELTTMIEKMAMEKCIKKSKVERGLVKNTFIGEFPPDKALGCYFKCVLGVMKLMKNDQLQPDYMKQQIQALMPEDIIERLVWMVGHCYGQMTKTDGCELALDAAKCWYETDKSLYIFPAPK